jgi:hypothetical protein
MRREIAESYLHRDYFHPVVPDKRSAISDVQLHIGGPIRRGGYCLPR